VVDCQSWHRSGVPMLAMPPFSPYQWPWPEADHLITMGKHN